MISSISKGEFSFSPTCKKEKFPPSLSVEYFPCVLTIAECGRCQGFLSTLKEESPALKDCLFLFICCPGLQTCLFSGRSEHSQLLLALWASLLQTTYPMPLKFSIGRNNELVCSATPNIPLGDLEQVSQNFNPNLSSL